MENTVIALSILLLVTVVLATFGRRLHQLLSLHEEGISFPIALLAGGGAYTLWWLAVVPVGGGHTLLAAILFLLLTLALAGHGILRQGTARSVKAGEHFYSMAVLHALLLWPWFGPLLSGSPTTVPDFTTLHLTSMLTGIGQWPAPEAWANLPSLTVPLGWLAPQVSASLPLGDVPPSLSPLLNGLMLLVAGGLLGQAAGSRISWSNLPLAAASSLTILLLLVPSLNLGAFNGQAPQLVGLLLLAAMLPVTGSAPLSYGWAALPIAFILAWLTTLTPLGLPLALLIALIWLVHGLVAQGPTPRVLLAATLLATLPLLAAAAQIHALSPLPGTPWCLAQLSTPSTLPTCLANLLTAPLAPWQLPLLVITTILSALSLALLHGRQRWLHLLPFGLAGILVAALFPWPETRALWPQILALCVPMFLLAPVRAWSAWYNHSQLRQRSYRYPWSLGILLMAVLLVIIIGLQPLVRPQPSPLLNHTYAAAQEIKDMSAASTNTPLATIGLPPLATAAMAYHLRHEGPVQAQPVTSGLQPMHRNLRQAGYPAAWVGPQAAQQVLGSPQPLEASLLLHTTPDALVIRNVYPVVSGTLAGLVSASQIK